MKEATFDIIGAGEGVTCTSTFSDPKAAAAAKGQLTVHLFV